MAAIIVSTPKTRWIIRLCYRLMARLRSSPVSMRCPGFLAKIGLFIRGIVSSGHVFTKCLDASLISSLASP